MINPPSLTDRPASTIRPRQTAIRLVVHPMIVEAGQPLLLTAEVIRRDRGAMNTGTIGFFLDGRLIGSMPIKNGIAWISYPGLPSGTHAITAIYQGSPYYRDSESLPQTVIVRRRRDALATTKVDAPPPASPVTQTNAVARLEMEPFSLISMPANGHLLTLETDHQHHLPILRTEPAKVIDVPVAVEETIVPLPPVWQFAPPGYDQVLLANSDTDDAGMREPLLEIRSIRPAATLAPTRDIHHEELSAPPPQALTGRPTLPRGVGIFTGGVRIGIPGATQFVPSRTTSRVPVARLLSQANEVGQYEPMPMPVIAAFRDGSLLRIVAGTPVAPLELPPIAPAKTVIDVSPPDEPFDFGDFGDFGNIFVG